MLVVMLLGVLNRSYKSFIILDSSAMRIRQHLPQQLHSLSRQFKPWRDKMNVFSN